MTEISVGGLGVLGLDIHVKGKKAFLEMLYNKSIKNTVSTSLPY